MEKKNKNLVRLTISYVFPSCSICNFQMLAKSGSVCRTTSRYPNLACARQHIKTCVVRHSYRHTKMYIYYPSLRKSSSIKSAPQYLRTIGIFSKTRPSQFLFYSQRRYRNVRRECPPLSLLRMCSVHLLTLEMPTLVRRKLFWASRSRMGTGV
jgi:hypothetical protein